MLRLVSIASFEDVLEDNTEPFLNQVGLGTSLFDVSENSLDLADPGEGNYVIEDEYGRIWSKEFFHQHKGLFAGPPLPAMVPFSNHGFLALPFRQAPRRRVDTREDLYRALAALDEAASRSYPKRVVVYRGQAKEYLVSRDLRERELLFGSGNVLEPSLRPSETRRTPLSETARAAWSLLVQRHLARCGSYAPAHRFAETGQAWPHATHLGEFVTLAFAQHYGLPTPALDVTTDFGVALWFALHTLTGSGGNTSVRPASGGEGVVYVIAGGRGEYFGEDLPDLTALRPRRQHGGFLASNWGNSKNRVARYLVGAVYFPHSLASEIISELPTGEYLFPGPAEDDFLKLLQRVAWHDRRGSEMLVEIAAHIYWIAPPAIQRDGPVSVVEEQKGTVPSDLDPDAPCSNVDLQRAVEAEDGGRGFRLGMHLYSAGNIEEAERPLRRSADMDDLESATVLGSLLSRRGDPEGELWTLRAASAGQPDAMNNLGLVHESRRELEDAERWYERAAKAGVIAAAYNLGSLLARTGRRNEAEHWLSIAAENGDSDAACDLGKLLYDRSERNAAERWFRAGADLGQAQAAYNLGQLCESDGRIEEASQWYRKAAENGDPDAPYRLARLRSC